MAAGPGGAAAAALDASAPAGGALVPRSIALGAAMRAHLFHGLSLLRVLRDGLLRAPAPAEGDDSDVFYSPRRRASVALALAWAADACVTGAACAAAPLPSGGARRDSGGEPSEAGLRLFVSTLLTVPFLGARGGGLWRRAAGDAEGAAARAAARAALLVPRVRAAQQSDMCMTAFGCAHRARPYPERPARASPPHVCARRMRIVHVTHTQCMPHANCACPLHAVRASCDLSLPLCALNRLKHVPYAHAPSRRYGPRFCAPRRARQPANQRRLYRTMAAARRGPRVICCFGARPGLSLGISSTCATLLLRLLRLLRQRRPSP